MTDTPPVTWLLPVRNAMPYLTATLQSIADQTYRNQKIIAWDNGSNDGTAEELHRWIPAMIPGLVISDQPMRLGPSLARMVEMADTELCARMDGDDLNVPDRLERQVAFLQKNPEVAILGGQLEIIDEQGRSTGERWPYPVNDADIRWILRWRNTFAHNTILFRRSVILEAGSYRDYQPYEDLDLWQRAANYTTKMHNLPDVLVLYRRTLTSSTGTVTSYLPTQRAAAELNASILFPGVTEPDRVSNLWEATHPNQLHLPSKLQHSRQLENAARLLAQQVGQPANYFTDTQTYQDQIYYLRRRALKRFGLSPLLRLRDRLSGARQSK